MSPAEEAKPAGTTTAAPDLFGSIGAQVDRVAGSGENQADGDDDVQPVEQIESLCMNCEQNGTTRLLLTRIPYFREIIIMSFHCDHCGFSNNEIQAAGSVQPRGSHIELRLTTMADFSRQVVKADTATVKFIELDLEIPPGRGQMTNVEGLLSGVVDDLEASQEQRRAAQPEVAEKVAEVIQKGRAMLAGDSFPFRFYVDDPAGNSWIQPDMRDGVGKWEKRDFVRSKEQNEALGLTDTDTQMASGHDGVIPVGGQGRLDENDNIPDEVYSFPASCPGCQHPCVTHMKMVDIPHFKQVVLMSTVCDRCGYRSNDVKTGGAVPEKGRKLTLRVKGAVDLARDILKSESCALECPDLSLSVNPGTLGGRFTTVEGLLTQVRNDLKAQIFEADATPKPGNADGHVSMEGGDSLAPEERTRWQGFFTELDRAIAGEREFSVVLTDPLASSYVQSLADDPGQPDEQMTVEDYDRTDEEEEELGLRDMKTEGYEEDAAREEAERKKKGVAAEAGGDDTTAGAGVVAGS
ncbi:zinc finger protein ZPR1 [Magnaporthiopsis poae ATCC 64411]|uniref:Zinc finger protein ZPR1 n=1 Tax=Magnaporthiopsis poae (strain ATCC 64411 / 73-15) TaxID=644358 RepID=A0A0C4DLR8_MAGP6|nr:zinc finger protein ZPR1 [Magnaporthiopsis poae ATCC 64411]